MNILLTGASGFIGSHILNALLKDGHRVCAAVHSRKPWIEHAQMETIVCDFSNDTRPDLWLERLQDIDVVVNTVGIISERPGQRFDAIHAQGPIALFRACEIAGVKRVIHISALGTADSDVSQYFTSKSKTDSWLKKSTLDYLILHPSMVYGVGAKSLPLLQALAALPVTPVIDGGEQKLQPVHIDDLAEAVVKGIKTPELRQREIPVVGAEAIGFRQLLASLQSWLGLGGALVVSLPARFGRLIGFAGVVLGEPAMRGSTIKMLMQGNTASAKHLTHLLGREPRSMGRELRQSRPAWSDIQYAKLYFLGPVLRLSIAFLWIWTGIVSLFLYPQAESYALLEQTGVPAQLKPYLLYGAGALDILVGAALLLRYRIVQITVIQVVAMLTYTLIITLTSPEYWLHPFGPLSKNIPLLVAILMVPILERR